MALMLGVGFLAGMDFGGFCERSLAIEADAGRWTINKTGVRKFEYGVPKLEFVTPPKEEKK